MKMIDGGVCAAKGFKANGVYCGIRKNKSKKDIAMITSDVQANAAAVYTTNLVKGAPILVTKKNLENGKASAMICNSGNANTCNADGIEIAEKMCALVEKYTGIKKDDIIIASTGVIGQPLPIAPIEKGIEMLAGSLAYENSSPAAQAIMTTDTFAKEAAVSFEIGGKTCHLGGIAKGSGMIHPNMATLLVFLTTDCAISSEMLQKAVSEDVKTSFNMVSVDGDTSTNDTLSIMANGLAENPEITADGEDFEIFKQALNAVTVKLCRMIAKDGEGATKLLECKLTGAKTKEIASVVSKSVICSSLVKAAMFGADANWGRILCAIGYSGADVDVNKVDVAFKSAKGTIPVCKNGAGIPFSEEIAKEILLENEIEILVDLNDGEGKATAWGCDLTYDYVKINGDYRT
ncbi:MAG: bifunctional ornithine acetyltransferase/N-acetylglutamate synthase [Christensenellaceae bacterium]|nr:bifunctional ornithine acetyltransferase/N-acetylglutamate synthase [Christensenellaceae bacterium]